MKTYPIENGFNSKKRAVLTGEKRPPKRGEYYLSGAHPMVYRAPNDLSTAYLICRLIPKPEPVKQYYPGF